MSYTNYFVAESSTRAGTLGEDCTKASCRAVMFNAVGDVVLATEPEKAMGILIASSEEELLAGSAVSFLVKDVGLMSIGSAVNKGDLVTIDSQGRAVKATSGSVVFGRAFTSGSLENSLVEVMVFPHGSTLGG